MYIASEQTNNKKVGPMDIKEYKLTAQFSGALIEINGNHGKVRCISQDRIYYIAEGTGDFFVDEEKFSVKKDDVVFVPMNTAYNFVGQMKIFLVCSPEFKKGDDIHLE
jgi:mannose-6-phosphate isomerase-like protein (cupin superfamily)